MSAIVVATLFLAALIMTIGVLFVFTFPLIVDRGLSGTDAVTVSARAVVRNFAGVLGLTLIGLVLSLLGALACYVGTFFILPISLAAMTIAYRKVFPDVTTEALPSPAL